MLSRVLTGSQTRTISLADWNCHERKSDSMLIFPSTHPLFLATPKFFMINNNGKCMTRFDKFVIAVWRFSSK